MRPASPGSRYVLVAVTAMMAALLACSLPDALREPQPAVTKNSPPTAPAPSATAPSTAVGTELSPSPPPSPSPLPSATTPPPTATRATSEPGGDSRSPANDPCGLPGIQFSAALYTAVSVNALLAPFSGDVQILNTPGGPNIFSMQQASVQRKFVIILPNLKPALYDLSKVYMSYTEKKDANDHNPRVWKATAGSLEILACPAGGLALRTVSEGTSPNAESALFEPLAASSNTASGEMVIEVGAKIQ